MVRGLLFVFTDFVYTDKVRQIVFSLGMIIIFLFFPFSVAAQDYGQPCSSLDNWPENHFDCQVNGNRWDYSSGQGEAGCSDGYVLNLALCDGTWPTRQICNTLDPVTHEVLKENQSCCLACIPANDGLTLNWGDACGPTIPGECDSILECRSNRCLRIKSTITFASECLDSSECVQGTADNPYEALVCREVSGHGRICSFPTDSRYCSSDEECVASTGNALATCVADLCQTPAPDPDIIGTTAEPTKGTPFDYCRQIPLDQRSACSACVARGAEGDYIFTAVGCIQVSGAGLAGDVIKLLLGVSGGVALLSLLAAAFKLSISRGDSGKIKEAKELITAAVTGLLFLIFSVIILEFIGVEILQIPGLG